MTKSLNRRTWLLAAGALGASFAESLAVWAAPSPEQPPFPAVFLPPLGTALGPQYVDFAARSLAAFYHVRIQRLEPAQLPRSAFYAPRARYRAERLLEFLEPRLPSDGYRIVGLTSVDIS